MKYIQDKKTKFQ